MKNVILFRKELFEYFPEIHYFIYRIALFKKKKGGFDLQCASFA